jgi:hypothetical protein
VIDINGARVGSTTAGLCALIQPAGARARFEARTPERLAEIRQTFRLPGQYPEIDRHWENE